MRALIYTVSIVLMMCLASCVQLPDLNPRSNKNLVVTEVEMSGFFSMYQHFVKDFDINGNGTVDFHFIGERTQDPFYGTVYSVRLEGAIPENKIVAKTLEDNVICTGGLPSRPVYALKGSFTVGPFNKWFNNVSFYDYQIGPNDCEDYMWHIPMLLHDWESYPNQDQYFGIRFLDNGRTYYGWINMNIWNQSWAGFPECPDVYRIQQFAYNNNTLEPLRIPE